MKQIDDYIGKIIGVLDYTPQDENYEYLGPREGGGIIVHIDEKHKVSVITLDFDECVTKFVRLWPYNSVQKNKFLDLERAPLSSPNMSTATNCGYSSDCNIIF